MGGIFFGWGVITLDLWFAIFGGTVLVIGKLWFADHMVWLYEDMKEATPEYKNWLY